MKKIIYFIVLMTIFSCKRNDKVYFEYDEIIHYSNEIDEEIFQNELKASKDSLKHILFYEYYPKSIKDSMFINDLEFFGYKKFNIDSKKFIEINQIFVNKSHNEIYETACLYVYRDILIFKKKSKIVGIAKICFECSSNVIVGARTSTSNFGMSGDYEKLETILYNKKQSQ